MPRKPTHIHRLTNPVAMCAVVYMDQFFTSIWASRD